MYTKLCNHFSFVKLTSWGSKIAQRKLSRTMFGCFFQKICSRLVVLRVKIHFNPLKFCNTRFKGEGRESKKLMIKKLMKKWCNWSTCFHVSCQRYIHSNIKNSTVCPDFRTKKSPWSCTRILTLYCITLKNGQTYFKILAVFTPQDF